MTTPFTASARLGRIPWPTADELDPERLALYETLTAGTWASGRDAVPVADADGRLQGPFTPMMISPTLGRSVQQVGVDLRRASTLTGRVREACILTVAVWKQSEFEWFGHLAAARKEGLTELEIAHIRQKSDAPTSFTEAESLCHSVVTELERDADLSDESFHRAAGELGFVTVQELVWLVGYYDMIALTLRVGRIPLPDGTDSEFDTSGDGSRP